MDMDRMREIRRDDEEMSRRSEVGLEIGDGCARFIGQPEPQHCSRSSACGFDFHLHPHSIGSFFTGILIERDALKR
jgi:hypothetical protein